MSLESIFCARNANYCRIANYELLLIVILSSVPVSCNSGALQSMQRLMNNTEVRYYLH